MPRHKNPIPPASKNLQLPSDIVARVDLLLYSELEGRVPHGAWAKLVTELLRNHLDNQPKEIK